MRLVLLLSLARYVASAGRSGKGVGALALTSRPNVVAMTDAWLNAIVLIDVVSGAVVGTVPLMGVNGMLVVGEYALVGSAVGFYRVALLGAEERAEMWMTRGSGGSMNQTEVLGGVKSMLREGSRLFLACESRNTIVTVTLAAALAHTGRGLMPSTHFAKQTKPHALAAADFGGSRAIFASSFGHADALTAYDAESAAVLKSWTKAPTKRWRTFSLVASGRELFALDGDKGGTIERYSLTADGEWSRQLVAGGKGEEHVDACGPDARFGRPHSMIFSPDDDALLVADTDNRALRRVSIASADFGCTTTVSTPRDSGAVKSHNNSCASCAELGWALDEWRVRPWVPQGSAATANSSCSHCKGLATRLSPLEASVACAKHGARLCTAAELKNKVTLRAEHGIASHVRAVSSTRCVGCVSYAPPKCEREWGRRMHQHVELSAAALGRPAEARCITVQNSSRLGRSDHEVAPALCCCADGPPVPVAPPRDERSKKQTGSGKGLAKSLEKRWTSAFSFHRSTSAFSSHR